MGNGNRFSETSFRFLVDVFSQQSTSFIFRKSVYLLQIELAKQQRRLCEAPPAVSVCCWKIQSGVTETCDSVLGVYVCVCVCFSLSVSQTAVEVFRRMILEAEKMDGGVQPGKTSCSMM